MQDASFLKGPLLGTSSSARTSAHHHRLKCADLNVSTRQKYVLHAAVTIDDCREGVAETTVTQVTWESIL